MDLLPPASAAELVTRDYLHAALAEQSERLSRDIARLDDKLSGDIARLGEKESADIAGVRHDILTLDRRVSDTSRQLLLAMVAMWLSTIVAVIVA